MSSTRLFYQLTPEHGAGYFLGILGALLMMLLLVYPIKKRVRGAPIPLSAKFWFRAHMQLGIFGPLLIVLHSKLNMGSTNSTAAFVFMVTVMVSGFVGRFLYQKVHVSLYGQRKDLDEYLQQLKERIKDRAALGLPLPALLKNPTPLKLHGPLHNTGRHLRVLRRSLRESENSLLHRRSRASNAEIDGEYLAWLRKVDGQLGRCVNLIAYERLFSWWHYLHLPIFFAFVLATVIHILAVHIY